jgi:hypothetical protein
MEKTITEETDIKIFDKAIPVLIKMPDKLSKPVYIKLLEGIKIIIKGFTEKSVADQHNIKNVIKISCALQLNVLQDDYIRGSINNIHITIELTDGKIDLIRTSTGFRIENNK